MLRCELCVTMLTKLVICTPSPIRSPAVASRKLNWPMNTWSASSSPSSPSMQVLGAMRVCGRLWPARPCSPNTMRKKSCRQSQRRQRLSKALMGNVAPECEGLEIVEEVRQHRDGDAPGRAFEPARVEAGRQPGEEYPQIGRAH